MEDAKNITGKVAAIIDATTLVLNVGSDQGVCEGQLFVIVSTHDEVFDPDTGVSLGRWESVKGKVVVTHAQAAMATARSPLVAESGDSTGTLSAMMVRHSFGLYGDRNLDRAPLEVRSGSITGRPRTQPIEIGDVARLLSPAGGDEHVRSRTNQPGASLPSNKYGSALPAQGGNEA
ncbi:MAG: hypothetical protein O2782_11255 [bacterium]|nr:hypothetical protein [bacterium]